VARDRVRVEQQQQDLTFTIRSGVKWTDGTPFSAADVAYTFNLLKKYPALDLNRCVCALECQAECSNKVVFDFSKSAVPYFYYVADQVPIVPEHIWSKIKNPVTDRSPSPWAPVATSWPVARPEHQVDSESELLAEGSARREDAEHARVPLEQHGQRVLGPGLVAYGAQFIPNIKSYFVAKKAGNGYWFPPSPTSRSSRT